MIFALLLAAALVPQDAVIHGLQVEGDVEVHVRTERARAVTATGDVDVHMDGDTLVVHAPARAVKERPVVTVTGPDALARVAVGGASRVDLRNLDGRALAVQTAGAAVLAIAGKAGAVTVTSTQTSRVDAGGLSAGSLDVTLADAARAEVRTSGALVCNLTRASRLTVKGKPSSVKKTVAGVAKLVVE